MAWPFLAHDGDLVAISRVNSPISSFLI
jgi:hypothetical protein